MQEKEAESLHARSEPVKQQEQLSPSCLNLYSRNFRWMVPGRGRWGRGSRCFSSGEGGVVEAENSRLGLGALGSLDLTREIFSTLVGSL